MRRTHGFTLIELMIVVAIIAIIAAIAIPSLLAARLAANESSAVSTLRNITSCQGQFQSGAKCDLDRDGTGEFGMFRELSGAIAIRTSTDGTCVGGSVLTPAVLSGAFRTMNAGGQVSRSGYLFAMQLPMDTGDAVGESSGTGTFSNVVGIDASETMWATYAWPASYGNSGNRTFFVNQGGDITGTDYSGYTGSTRPAANAAFSNAATIYGMTGRVAIGTRGMDGKTWKQIN